MLQHTDISGLKNIPSTLVQKTEESLLTAYQGEEPLLFTISGSPGYGKSSLIKALLNNDKSIPDDQRVSAKHRGKQLKVEKEKKAPFTIASLAGQEYESSIGVDYPRFKTPRHRFSIVESPGHIGYTPDSVTGASVADATIILVDAQSGITPVTKRHLAIASLLQIQNVIVALNKIDLVDFSEEVFHTIKREFEEIVLKLNLNKTNLIPICATEGDNIAHRSVKTPWYNGEILLHMLENTPVHNNWNALPARFPVQNVVPPVVEKFPGYIGYTGLVSGGSFRVGDTILALPANKLSTIKAIESENYELNEAFTSQLVTIRLDGNVHINRSDMFVKRSAKYPRYSSTITLHICWLDAKPLKIGGNYSIRHLTSETSAVIKDIRYKVDINTLENITDDKTVNINDIAHITITTLKPLKYDDFSENPITGSLILIDETTGAIAGTGMIISDPEIYSYNI